MTTGLRSRRTQIDLPLDPSEATELLADSRTWEAVLPGATTLGSNDGIRLDTGFAQAELSIVVQDLDDADGRNDGARRRVVLEGRSVTMGPVEHLEIHAEAAPPAGVRGAPPTGDDTGQGSRVFLTVRWKGDVPYYWFLFRPLFGSYFAKLIKRSAEHLAQVAEAKSKGSRVAHSPDSLPRPWWAPADKLSVFQTRALASLCLYGMVMGYMTSLTGIAQHQIVETFHADDAALGRMLFALGLGSIPGVFLLPLGDRIGRRRILVPTLVLTAVATTLSALAPTLLTFTVLQTLVRAPLFVALSLAWIYLVEEMPVRARAYAISLFTMTGGLGGGIGLFGLPVVQRISDSGWRILFGAGVLALSFAPTLARDLPETKRFVRAWHGTTPLYLLKRPHFRRLAILVAAALASSVFGSPAARFQGRYIQNALGYSPGAYVIFTVVTTLPAAPGMILGGRLADIWGRKTVGTIAATAGAVSQTLLYWLSGPPLWISSAIGSFVGAMWIPALGSFSTELFPTSLRANASSVTSAAGMAGGATGSWLAGWLVVALGSYGMAVTALLPAALIAGLLVLTLFPETKGRELEEISPEIEGPPSDVEGPLPGMGRGPGFFG